MQISQELQQSIQRYESYARIDPDNLILKMKLGDLYHEAGRLGDSIACYEQCLLQSPALAPARSRLASVMISQHRFVEAEKSLSALIENNEPDVALIHNLGLTLYYQERWDEARKCFSDAAERGLKLAANYAYLSRALHHLGLMAESIAACRSWVELAPDNESMSYLALLYMDDGNAEMGRKLALDVLAKNSKDINANIVAGIASVERQEIREAGKHFETVLQQERDNGRAWLGLGLVHLYNQESAKAIEALENAVRIYPDNSGIIVTLGWAKLAGQNVESAEKIFEQALRINHNFSESHGGLAAALAFQNKLDRAEEEIKLARRLDPNGFGAAFAQTVVYVVRNQQDKATTLFARILERSPREGMPPLIDQLRLYSTLKGRATKPSPQKTVQKTTAKKSAKTKKPKKQ